MLKIYVFYHSLQNWLTGGLPLSVFVILVFLIFFLLLMYVAVLQASLDDEQTVKRLLLRYTKQGHAPKYMYVWLFGYYPVLTGLILFGGITLLKFTLPWWVYGIAIMFILWWFWLFSNMIRLLLLVATKPLSVAQFKHSHSESR